MKPSYSGLRVISSSRVVAWWTLANISRATDLLLKLGAIPVALAALSFFVLRPSMSWTSLCDVAFDEAAARSYYLDRGVVIPPTVLVFIKTWNDESHEPPGQGFPYYRAQLTSTSLCKVGPVLFDVMKDAAPERARAIKDALSIVIDGSQFVDVPVWLPAFDPNASLDADYGMALSALQASAHIRGFMDLANGGPGDARNVRVGDPYPVSFPGGVVDLVPAHGRVSVAFEFGLQQDVLDTAASQPILRWDDEGPDFDALGRLCAGLVLVIWLPVVLRDVARCNASVRDQPAAD